MACAEVFPHRSTKAKANSTLGFHRFTVHLLSLVKVPDSEAHIDAIDSGGQNLFARTLGQPQAHRPTQDILLR
jgi:hypothetical protein